MSYILEALKKSEQERQIGHVPDLSMIQETPHRTAPRWPRWLLAALLLNAVILVFLAWRAWDAHMSSKLSSAQTPAVPAQAATAAVPPAPIKAPIEPAAAPAATEIDTAEPVLPEPVSEMPAPAPESEPSALMQEPEWQAQPQPQLGPDLEPLPAPESADVTAGVPRWEDLPSAERSQFPVPRIDVHVFAQEPERRFVLINLRKYQQGDTLEDGAVIEAILADGIVLSYQGQQYRVDRP